MGAELGRISGPLLAANLLRNGVDLSFSNTYGDTPVIYLDVFNGRIGINNDAPTHDLLVPSVVNTTNLIVDTKLDINPNFVFTTNIIQHYADTIYIRPNQLLDPKIVTDRVGTSNLRVSDKLIENITNNSNIELSPNGSGNVVFDTNVVNITGNLHSTNNITADGSVIFGNTDADSTYFNSDINSDLIPNVTNQFNIGSSEKRWNTLYANNIVTSDVLSSTAIIGDINLVLERKNTLYVAVNGNDNNYGTHQRSPFKTLKHALSVASSEDQIFIFPGTYEEDFPLTVPQGVSISGGSLRSVIIKPTVATKDKDGFLLNGETTVENLTVSGFYYNSVNNTGYAFRLATDSKVTTRSAYVRNVTVITSGSSANPLSDRLGFSSGDAGRGALIDGSVVNLNSKEASILFHAATFIVPNADGITATNGARVEWLNSFTYYANRGIHLIQGSAGFASQGERFGAEMRSINSANVYGNYGAVADGANTLGYLIGHNFGYIGTGANDYNDNQLVIQANEVIELNSGRIYFDSVDHKGDYRIGNIFYVNQETGNVTFDASSINFGSEGSIVLEGPSTSTIINNTAVQTGNIKVYDNNIISLTGPINFSAASEKTYLSTNVLVTGNTDVTGNTKISGDIYLGNQPTDLIIIAPELSQDILPGPTDARTLGSTTKRWNTLYNTLLDVDGIVQVTNNTISTLTTNTDLQLVSAGTGKIYVPSDNVVINQSLTVDKTLTINGTTSLKNTEILGNISIVGDINQTGNTSITGTFSNNNIKISGSSYFSVPNIKIFNNEISALALDNDLVFSASGTGGVILDQKIKFVDNVISNNWSGASTDLQKSVIFTPNGTGNVALNTNKSLILPIGSNAVRTMYQTGEIRYNSNFNTFEGFQGTGRVSFNDIYDSDKNTYITAELTPGANDNTIRFGINGTVKATINSTAVNSNTYHFGNVSISGNNIGNLVDGNDLILAPTSSTLNVNSLLLNTNSIINPVNSPLILQSTGVGYIKFAGTAGVVIPTGSSEQRRPLPEVGEVRHNTTLDYMEVYTGDTTLGDNGWIPVTGVSGAATLSDVLDIMDEWALILG